MKTINTGGTAFPMQDPQAIHAYAAAQIARVEDQSERDRRYLEARAEAVSGMTLRDYFAAKAMPVAHDFWTRIFYPEIDPDGDDHPFSGDYSKLIKQSAESAYEMADAMLAAREQGRAA